MAEGRRLASILGSRNQVLMLSNHGVLVVYRIYNETFDRLYYLERATQVQVYAMWTG
jgi:ribulose-5-phosphate 4-epimerase/fuculose-1-phosphate aldolase